MARTHEAGQLHAPGSSAIAFVPAWLTPPADANELLPKLWARTVERGADGALRVGGVGVAQLAAEHGTPLYVVDELDFRSRATAFRDAFAGAFADLCGGADVYYATKAFVATGVARWLAEDGLSLDTSSSGELELGLRGGVPGERIALHGNNKSRAEIEKALRAGVGRVVVDSLQEVDVVADVAASLGVVAPVMLRITVGVEAHTHSYIATAHEDQKFGLSLASGVAEAAVAKVLARPELRLLGLHSHIGSQIFDMGGFEVSARRLLGLHRAVEREHGVTLPEMDLGGGFGVAYTSEHDPLGPEEIAGRLADIVSRECLAQGIAVPRISVEPGRAIAAPSTFTLYEVGTTKDVELDGGVRRRYVSVDGGMSDNIRTALYDADYSATLASRASGAPGVLSRVVGKHCESGDVVVKDEFLPADAGAGDLLAVPGTGAYCRSMASNYNQITRPAVVSVRDGVSTVLVRRETPEDLLALDAG
ncbi:diaminopimelate decarboxylase [Paenibacillus sp. TRM 82003]|uniref:diaminopimelate decarboxylase n=1 Tax=Kineococcus sp. TRM81007 TaxID=2925831 RepID=UPI001F58BC43|nr:diaminopimelate decarboxylase [Kineococcus sp. TRM81007]MCI2239290.1 diaminopimelate decarboxylase [Kineococcus sp. TRM81007]MCI3924974.1 diaminopimelate decarboxylase [Paenibacillus sp. TRM 82003]